MSRTLATSIVVFAAVLLAVLSFTMFVSEGLPEPIQFASFQPASHFISEPGLCACSPVQVDAPDVAGATPAAIDGPHLVVFDVAPPDVSGQCTGRPQVARHSVEL